MWGVPAEGPHHRACEEVVGGKAGHRVAGKDEHPNVVDGADPRWGRWSHRDAVNREVAEFTDEHGDPILRADRCGTGRDDEVGARAAEGVRHRLAFVEEAHNVREATVPLDECGEHRRGCQRR